MASAAASEIVFLLLFWDNHPYLIQLGGKVATPKSLKIGITALYISN